MPFVVEQYGSLFGSGRTLPAVILYRIFLFVYLNYFSLKNPQLYLVSYSVLVPTKPQGRMAFLRATSKNLHLSLLNQ